MDFWEDLLCILGWIIGAALVVFALICVCSLGVQSHGAGEMNAYITKVTRVGDRVFVTAKDSRDSSNTYTGCASVNDEQMFKNSIGTEVKLVWDGAFSIAPFWTECPGPLHIKGELNGDI